MSKETSPLVQIAKVLKSNGADGEMIFSFRDIEPEDIDLEEPIFVFFDGLSVPFFIRSLTPKGKGRAALQLVDVNSFEDSEELVGKDVWADADAYEDCMEEEFEDFTGWTLKDVDGTVAGTVTSVEDIPGNPCVNVVNPEGREFMVPLHEDLILSLDEDSKVLVMDIPEGL